MSFLTTLNNYVKLNVALQVVGVLLLVAGFLMKPHWLAGPIFWLGLLFALVGFVWSMVVKNPVPPS